MQNAHFVNNLPHALTPLAIATKAVAITATASTLPTLGSFTFSDNMRYVQLANGAATVRTDPSGNAPTSSVGQPVLAGQVLLLSRAEALTGKWILATGTSSIVQLNQYS